ncbi:MAG: NUDIX domain-containing protein [Candidatus Diapherotrites archaeon]|uniref:NUDIX domain-containing protein n=1 Tax=Candidatus Iainarchaeum sp. TaxID=3101447 RepID=A0A8T4LAC7_9ARCH|nr:NUDIX domain-containing protein [Candidatus Diapherotrites archaeon]
MEEFSRTFSASAYVVHDQKVLLVRNKKLDLWLAPGGHLLPNELPHIGAKREVKEETGLDIRIFPSDDETDIDGASVLPNPHHVIVYKMWPGHEVINMTYFAKPVSAILKPNEREIAEAKWADITELEKMNLPKNTKKFAIEAIKTVDEKP